MLAWRPNSTPRVTGSCAATILCQLIATDISSTANIGRMRTVYGTMTFDGNGAYQFRGMLVDTGAAGGQAQTLNISGRYRVGANWTRRDRGAHRTTTSDDLRCSGRERDRRKHDRVAAEVS